MIFSFFLLKIFVIEFWFCWLFCFV